MQGQGDACRDEGLDYEALAARIGVALERDPAYSAESAVHLDGTAVFLLPAPETARGEARRVKALLWDELWAGCDRGQLEALLRALIARPLDSARAPLSDDLTSRDV